MDLYLEDLITALEGFPQDGILPDGFGHPMSYRGYYCELAFEPVEDAMVGDMLHYAYSALGETFEGYKGGDYTMKSHSECYIASYGCTGDQINTSLVKMWERYLELSEQGN